MKGIVLVSHGDMAKGMMQTATLFAGDDIEQLECCCLQKEDSPEKFGKKISEAISKVNTGDGVFVLADMLGGTPCNQAIFCLEDDIDLIAGFNLSMFIEILIGRTCKEINLEELITSGQKSITDVKKLLAHNDIEEDD